MAEMQYIEESPVSKWIFGNPKMAWLWLIVRVYVGWQWLHAGWGKVTSDVWVGSAAGKSVSGFLQGALNKTTGAHPDVQSWYAAFVKVAILPYASFWSHVIAYGEFIVGLALIIGALTGIAAFFGMFMNLNFLLAGTVSINPVLLALSLLLVLAWRTAGYIGVDRYLLPVLGTPWRPGNLFRRKV